MIETIGQYKVLDQIGSGGIGDLFRARDTRVGRTVALKVVSPDIAADAQRRARFLNDAAPLTSLSHPSIASVYEVGEDNGVLFLATEFVPGETLNRVIAGRGLNARRAMDYAIQMADALAEAHAVGIVHGHLTTANVIVTPKGTVKILEFGLGPWTRSGRSNEKRDDIFALGTVLFELVAGRPFGDDFTPAEQRAISKEVPPELDDIIGRLLSHEPDRAYASPATAAAELRQAADAVDKRTEDRPAPVPPPVKKSGSMRWVIALAVIAVIAAIAWMLVRG
jgi:eukaryotic-like serine/threonine-protein kinase